MGVALVYLAEHYVLDLLVAVVIAVAIDRLVERAAPEERFNAEEAAPA